MRGETLAAIAFSIAATTFSVALLVFKQIGEVAFVALVALFALVALAIHSLSRLRELDLRSLKLTLHQIEAVKREVSEVKDEIQAMYGGIESIRRSPLVLNNAKMAELGLDGNGLALASATMRYPVGCIKRERERIARIFIAEPSLAKLAQAILDNSLDDQVFKWAGPESVLDDAPVSLQERRSREAANDT